MNRALQFARILKRLHRAASSIHRPVAFMEVCGTHTMAAFRSGLRSLLPDNIHLVSGPGCPVCVTAQCDIDLLMDLASLPQATLCTYGDMLRVPGLNGSLERARAEGADVRIIYSTLDAVALAQRMPHRKVILAAVGFETTAPATAAALLAAQRAELLNFSVFACHKRVIPALTALLNSGQIQIDGLLCPGHVSAIIGASAYRPITEFYRLPCVVAGFEETHMAAAIATLAEQVRDCRTQLINEYPEAVTPHGNRAALAILDQVFETTDVRWRALGIIRQSGMGLRREFEFFDATRRFALQPPEDREIPGCLCGKVILGAAIPPDCRLFGSACNPIHPIGPCMVSSEGTCQAYFKYARVGVVPRSLVHHAAAASARSGPSTPRKEGQPSSA